MFSLTEKPFLSFRPVFRSQLILSSFIAFFKFHLINDFGKPSKDRTFKIDTDVTIYYTKNSSPNVVGSAKHFGTGMTSPDELQHPLQSVDLTIRSDSSFVVVSTVVIH